MDDLLPVGQQLGEGSAGRRRVGLLHPRGIDVWADGDAQSSHLDPFSSLAASAASTCSEVIGCCESQTPVASWMALATAAAKGTSAISATPRAPYGPSGSASSRITGTISVGMSSTVGSRYVLRWGVRMCPFFT